MMLASRSQAMNLSSMMKLFDDTTPNVDLGKIVVTIPPPDASGVVSLAWEATKDTVGAGIVGAVSAVGSAVAQEGAWVGGPTKAGINAATDFVINKATNGFSICPRYGNWGGLDWSGGKQIQTGEIGPKIDATDQMDEYFKQHDICCYKADNMPQSNFRKQYRAGCDLSVDQQLHSLPEDPARWNPPAQDQYKARRYKKLAEWYFDGTLNRK